MLGNGIGYRKEIFISLFPNLCNQSLIVHNNLASGIPPSFVKVRIKERKDRDTEDRISVEHFFTYSALLGFLSHPKLLLIRKKFCGLAH